MGWIFRQTLGSVRGLFVRILTQEVRHYFPESPWEILYYVIVGDLAHYI